VRARYFSGLREGFCSGRFPETQSRGFRRLNDGNVSRAGFRTVSCAALLVVFRPRSGCGEAKDALLFLPIVRETSREGDKPRRRQLDRVLASEDGPDNVGREVR
jgi:hypothetical protein